MKTSMRLLTGRIKLLVNKKAAHMTVTRRELADLLATGKARIRGRARTCALDRPQRARAPVAAATSTARRTAFRQPFCVSCVKGGHRLTPSSPAWPARTTARASASRASSVKSGSRRHTRVRRSAMLRQDCDVDALAPSPSSQFWSCFWSSSCSACRSWSGPKACLTSSARRCVSAHLGLGFLTTFNGLCRHC